MLSQIGRLVGEPAALFDHDSNSCFTGLYTSPHLCAVRERIRVNGRPLSEDDFAKYFFEVWDKLENDFVVACPLHLFVCYFCS